VSQRRILNKLTPLIGAEITNVDLASPSEGLIAQLKQDLNDHHVIFFHDQQLTLDQFKAFGRAFGPLHIHGVANPTFPQHPEVIVIETDENSTFVAGERWHSDASADAEPPFGTILYMHVVPEHGGGDTLFASTCDAYDALSSAMKRFLDGLTAVHDGERLRGLAGIRNQEKRLPANEHPVVRTNPETGRKGIYVNRVYTSHIVGLPKAESEAILSFLYTHMEQPLFQCRFKWSPGSIAFWDNRFSLHHAVWDYFPDRRMAQRITVCGERPA